jgi:trigger factor
VNEEFAKTLGVDGGTVEALRADIKKNLEREVKFRVQGRNKQAVMDALVSKAELDLPKASVQAEVGRLLEGAAPSWNSAASRTPPRPRSLKTCSCPKPSAACAWAWWWPSWSSQQPASHAEQIKAHVEELASSYEKPEDVVRWYFGDRNAWLKSKPL